MPPQNPSPPGPSGPPGQKPKGQGPPAPPKRAPVGLLIGILLVVLIFWMVADRGPGREISYTTFQRVLEAGHVVGEVRVGESSIEGKVESGVLPEKGETALGKPDGGPPVEFYAVRHKDDGTEKFIDDYNNAHVKDAAKQNPRRNVVNRSIGPTLLLWLPMLLIMGVMVVFLMRRMGGYGEQVMAFGKSKARISLERNTGTTFEDVAGCEEAKDELTEIVAYLKHPERFRRLGGKIPKGVLLMGPPGTGKTLMARAVAGEAAVPFISVSGPEFMEMFVGVGAARVRDLFAKAKQKAPCIVFMDEIDAVGRHRGAGMGGGQEEREQTLNQLLVEMDGFEGTIGVIVLAATNRPDILDPALLRPGRFDRQVVLDHPDARGRAQILAVHARGKAMAPDVNLEVVAQRTPGFTGADLANVMNEAALLAARREREHITMVDVEEAIDRVLAGPERRSRVIRPKEKQIIAYHECGHALTAAFIADADPVHKVSIVPRGHAALGYTLQLPEQDRYVLRKEELLGRICVSLGGRTAEELAFGQQSTGAADDLDRVTDIARSMICRYGMSTRLGPLVFERPNGRAYLNGGHESAAKGNFSEETLAVIDSEAKEIVEACQARTRAILTTNRPLLDRMAARLLEVEVMDAADFRAAVENLCGQLGLAPPPKRTDEA